MSYTRYDWNEIRKHSHEKDAWIVIDGYVYDVTHFLDIHPGGANIIAEHLGKDATEAFNDFSIHEHSANALEMMKKFRIGVVEGKVISSTETRERTIEEKAREYGIDLNKGLVIPVSKLGDKYQEFLEAMGTMPLNRLRYFDNDLLEKLTVCPWYAVPLWWLPISLVFFVLAVNNGIQLRQLPFFLLTGPLGWGFVEYMLHKYVFHMKSKTFVTNAIHFLVHGYHHLLPMDHLRLVFPPTFGSFIGAAIYSLLRLLLPLEIAQAQFAGMIIGYVFYDCTHYFVHHKQMNIPFFREMKKHHLYHHYNNHESNYGISMKLYDYLFGTYVPSSSVSLS